MESTPWLASRWPVGCWRNPSETPIGQGFLIEKDPLRLMQRTGERKPMGSCGFRTSKKITLSLSKHVAISSQSTAVTPHGYCLFGAFLRFFLWDVVSRLLQDSRHLQITNVPMMEHMQLNVQHSRRCCFCFFHFRPTEKVHASQGKSCFRVKTSLQSQVIIDYETIKYQILVKKKQLSPVAKQGLDFLHPDTFAAVVLLL